MERETRAQAKRAFCRATIELKPRALIVVEIQLVAPLATATTMAAIGGECEMMKGGGCFFGGLSE